MRIGEVAIAAGCNIQTLRYYERRGLLRPPTRTQSGYRDYPAETVQIIRFIKRAQELGFTLEEIRELLRLRRRDSRRRNEVRSIAEAKMRDVEMKIARLHSMHRALDGLVRACACRDASLECPILEALNDAEEREKRHATRRDGQG